MYGQFQTLNKNTKEVHVMISRQDRLQMVKLDKLIQVMVMVILSADFPSITLFGMIFRFWILITKIIVSYIALPPCLVAFTSKNSSGSTLVNP